MFVCVQINKEVQKLMLLTRGKLTGGRHFVLEKNCI